MDNNVPEPSPWLDLAAELERIAADLRTLVGEPAPRLFALDIQPHNADGIARNTAKNRPATIAAVDAVAVALLGKSAETKPMSGGVYHHMVRGNRGPINVNVYQSVADPTLVDPEQEIERLRAENAQLRAAADRRTSQEPVISDETIEAAGRMGSWNEREQRRDDPTGLLYTRADDKGDEPAGECLGRDMDCGRPLPCPDHPTADQALTDRAREVLAVAPVSPARVPMHIGVVDDKEVER